MDKTALMVALFFTFIISAGIGFQVARWLF
jgi:hypothetical protein